MDDRWARPWFTVTAACVAAGIVIQICLAPGATHTFGGSPLNRALNIFAFFTIESNVLVGVACLLLAIDPIRRSAVFALLRMTGLIGITVTFVVFHVVLSRLLDIDGWAQAANQFQHTVVPILAVVGWVAFGPRGLATRRTVLLSTFFPLLYFAFTMVRGPLASHWYPYPFINVRTMGYLTVAVNAVWVALLFLGFGAAAATLDKKLGSALSALSARGQPRP